MVSDGDTAHAALFVDPPVVVVVVVPDADVGLVGLSPPQAALSAAPAAAKMPPIACRRVTFERVARCGWGLLSMRDV